MVILMERVVRQLEFLKKEKNTVCISESQKLRKKSIKKIRLFPKAHRVISLLNIFIFPLTLYCGEYFKIPFL